MIRNFLQGVAKRTPLGTNRVKKAVVATVGVQKKL